jgi:ADP-ribose pyrophosphatase YjhB (NUDIX family)
MKKRGFGVGLWNGAGGKLLPGERVNKAATRDVKEELGVEVIEAERVAFLHFYFPDDPAKADWNQDVHVFLVRKWTGTPQPSEEMEPRWFAFPQIKYLTMWDGDKYWLPRVLKGEMLEGWFNFDDTNEVLEYEVKNVEEGGKIS